MNDVSPTFLKATAEPINDGGFRRKFKASLKAQDISAQRALAKHHPNLLAGKRVSLIEKASTKRFFRKPRPIPAQSPAHVVEYYDLDTVPSRSNRTASDIIHLVCKAADIRRDELEGRSRVAYICEARQAAYWLVKKHKPNISFNQIGNMFLKDHATIIHGVNRVNREFFRFSTLIQAVEARI